MLIFSENRLVPTTVNMLTIKAKDDSGYFYIHRLLYDQAVIISDIYGDDFESLIKEITGRSTSREDVYYFYENAPAPINILGAFLLLVNDEIDDFIDMVGAIHVMSGPVHLRNMLRIPYNMRNMQFSFSLSIKEEYQLAWDNFFQSTPAYDASMFSISTYAPMNGVATNSYMEEEEKEITGYEEYGLDSDALDALMGDDDIFADMDEELDNTDPFALIADKDEEENTEVTDEQEPVELPKEPVKKNLIDELISL